MGGSGTFMVGSWRARPSLDDVTPLSLPEKRMCY